MVTYNNDVPDGPNNPSQDQPKMKTNTNAIDTILDVDHISFNADSGGGEHKHVTFLSDPAYVVPGVISGDSSVIYSDAGTASTRAQLFYKNSLATTHLSCIRAWGYIDAQSTPPAVLSGQSYNVASVSIAANVYTVTLTANACSSDKYAILVTAGAGPLALQRDVPAYTISSATEFTLTFGASNQTASRKPTSFSFIVLQI